MALEPAEDVDVRRYCGYPVSPGTPDTLSAVLGGLTEPQEAVVRTVFLPPLAAMEAGFAASVKLVGTKQAAVFVRNENELRERAAMFHWQRLGLCRFLGVPPGEGLALTDLPPFTTCCPRTTASSGGGGSVDPTDPTADNSTPMILVV